MKSVNNVRIATYNTSFASDLGLAIGSEKHFLKRIETMENKRQFFENSIDHAIEWCQAEEAPWGAIGFQEMNTPEKLPGYFDYMNDPNKQHDDRGINYTIDRFRNELEEDKVRSVSRAVYFNNSYPTVLTIWNTAVFGELKGSGPSGEMGKYSYVYVSEMETDAILSGFNEKDRQTLKKLPDPKPQGGRPILIVLTERDGKKYLLVNLHAPNRQPGNVELQMKLTAFCIHKHIEQALKKFGITDDNEKEAIARRMFIMGDFNGFFTETEPFTFMGRKFSAVKEGDQLPLSCCYNFNSSCPEIMRSGVFREEFNKIATEAKTGKSSKKMSPGESYLVGTNEAQTFVNEKGSSEFPSTLGRKVIDPKFLESDFVNKFSKGINFVPEQDLFQVSSVDHECVIVRSLDKSRDQSLKGTKRDMDSRGKIENYVLPGDFVLGPIESVEESAKIVAVPDSVSEERKETDGVSKRSDHEMVSVTFKLLNEETTGTRNRGGRRVKRVRTKKNKNKKTKKNRVKTSKESKRNNLNK